MAFGGVGGAAGELDAVAVGWEGETVPPGAGMTEAPRTSCALTDDEAPAMASPARRMFANILFRN